ncbi:MAG: ATP-binding protein, partial [Clostridiales bacterium]|nr:ATP-binding protein [Clostridiales bacterium]
NIAAPWKADTASEAAWANTAAAWNADGRAEAENAPAAVSELELDSFPYEEEESSEYDDLQVELAKSVRKVIAGVARKPELNEDDVPAAVEERLRDIKEIRERREPEPTPGRLSIDDILLSMGEKGKQAAAAARAQREAEAAAAAEAEAASQEETAAGAEVAGQAETAAEAEAAAQEETAAEAEVAGQAETVSQAETMVTEAEAVGQDESAAAAEAELAGQADPAAAAESAAQEETASEAEAETNDQAEEAVAAMEAEAADQAGMTAEAEKEAIHLTEAAVMAETEAVDPEEAVRILKAAAGAFNGGTVSHQDGTAEDFVSSVPAKSVTAAEAEELPREQLEALKYASNPEKLLRNRNSLPTYSSGPDLAKTHRINTKEELLEAARRELMMTKTIRIPTEEVAKAYSYRTADFSEAASEAGIEAASSDGLAQSKEEGKAAEMEDVNFDAEREEEYQERAGMTNGMDAEPVQELREEPDEAAFEEEEPEEYFDDPLTIEPHLRGLFQGFTEVEGLEDQIANAILQAMAKGADRTSRNGNILIFGAHGAGKTTLAIGLAKAIAQEKGQKTAKMAKIYAVDLNRRDIAATIAKIAGGTLIIEEAGDLADNTVEQLTTAMEFRTDGLIVILEDEQRYIHDLLMKHPRFTMKFTAQIYLPVYTADELAMFALRHAREQDYSISEDGYEAIRQKIAERSSTETPMSVGDIVELVDQAIRNSNKFMRKMSMGKKRYDENDYVLLFAKDFK